MPRAPSASGMDPEKRSVQDRNEWVSYFNRQLRGVHADAHSDLADAHSDLADAHSDLSL